MFRWGQYYPPAGVTRRDVDRPDDALASGQPRPTGIAGSSRSFAAAVKVRVCLSLGTTANRAG
jgi:hypothetical protein